MNNNEEREERDFYDIEDMELESRRAEHEADTVDFSRDERKFNAF